MNVIFLSVQVDNSISEWPQKPTKSLVVPLSDLQKTQSSGFTQSAKTTSLKGKLLCGKRTTSMHNPSSTFAKFFF